MALSHSLPKVLTFLMTLPFIPRAQASVMPYLLSVVAICLALHQLAPNKYTVSVTPKQHGVIVTNLALTGLSLAFFVRVAGDRLADVQDLMSIPPIQLIYPVMWIVSDETLFFFIHRFAHRPAVYQQCHKMHHKFKITSAWTSFYSHPLDHTIAVVWAALALPLLMMRVLEIPVAAPVITAFLQGAIVTFIGSHHTILGEKGDDEPVGTDHLVHHKLFTVNYGNFGYFDALAGSYATTKKAIQSWP